MTNSNCINLLMDLEHFEVLFNLININLKSDVFK